MSEAQTWRPLLFSATKQVDYSMLVNAATSSHQRRNVSHFFHTIAGRNQHDALEQSRLFCARMECGGHVLGCFGYIGNVLGVDHPMAADNSNRKILFVHGLVCEDAVGLPGSKDLAGLREKLAAELRKACDAVSQGRQYTDAVDLSFAGPAAEASAWDDAIRKMMARENITQIWETATPGVFEVAEHAILTNAEALPKAAETAMVGAQQALSWRDRIFSRRGACVALGGVIIADGVAGLARAETNDQRDNASIQDKWTTRVFRGAEVAAGAAIAFLGRRLP